MDEKPETGMLVPAMPGQRATVLYAGEGVVVRTSRDIVGWWVAASGNWSTPYVAGHLCHFGERFLVLIEHPRGGYEAISGTVGGYELFPSLSAAIAYAEQVLLAWPGNGVQAASEPPGGGVVAADPPATL